MPNHSYQYYLIFLLAFIGIGFSDAQTTVAPTDANFQYTGRMDFTNPNAPILYYAGSYITTRFTGTSLKASFKDITGNNYVGFIIDGGQMIVKSAYSTTSSSIKTIATGLTNTTHDLIIVKRNGPTAGAIVFYGLTLDTGKSLAAPLARPTRRIEIFGNSISAGVNADNAATNDDRTTTLDNGWNSYSNILARKLNAEIHNNGIPGIAVMTGTGYYTPSAEVAYNKLSPFSGYYSNWDFTKYIPQLVIMAYGVNDDGNDWVNANNKETWKAKYKAMLTDLMTKYPLAHFVFLVPPMGMDRTRMEGYDIEIVNEVNSSRVHFYNITTAPSPSGAHPAKAMHQGMADELYTYINSLGIFSTTSTKALDSTELTTKFDIYPNPTQGNFSIKLNFEHKADTIYLKIIDIEGKIIYTQNLYTNSLTITPPEPIKKGLYLVELKTSTEKLTKKLVIN